MEAFKEEFDVVVWNSPSGGSHNEAKANKKSLRRSALYRLDPFIDHNGILRVGSCLCQTTLGFHERYLRDTTSQRYYCTMPMSKCITKEDR